MIVTHELRMSQKCHTAVKSQEESDKSDLWGKTEITQSRKGKIGKRVLQRVHSCTWPPENNRTSKEIILQSNFVPVRWGQHLLPVRSVLCPSLGILSADKANVFHEWFKLILPWDNRLHYKHQKSLSGELSGFVLPGAFLMSAVRQKTQSRCCPTEAERLLLLWNQLWDFHSCCTGFRFRDVIMRTDYFKLSLADSLLLMQNTQLLTISWYSEQLFCCSLLN